jgi:uncharacterized membrane protein YjfL (UPF0719 family)
VNFALIVLGGLKLAVGIAVGGVAVWLAYQVLSRTLKVDSIVDNPAAGALHASVLLALALLMRNSLGATYDTMDLLLRRGSPGASTLVTLATHGLAHLVLGLVLGSALFALGIVLFNRLTPGVDEVAAVREGKLGPALLLGAIVVTLSLLAAPGLEALLAGLVPFPSLPLGTGVAPS